MKILHTATITIAIVLMIIISPVAFGTLSFAARTNSTGSSAQHNNNNITASSSNIPNINSPKIITNAASHNATTSSMSAGNYPGSYTCSNTDNFLWNHVYGASGNGKETWNRPNQQHPAPASSSRLKELSPSCITVTGTVYSAYPGGTEDDPDGDGDLHFTLTLDKAYEMYSSNKPLCKPHGGGGSCKNIIVEVICHKDPAQKYRMQWGDYCSRVNPVFYKPGQFPKQGDRLTVSGKFVFDTGGEQWNEIHPASNIK
jgi:hypothetical protein